MDQPFQPVLPIKSALFVDFDNIYIGLSKTDPAAAERFASDPNRWLAWLEKGLPDRTGIRARSILIRRCYPNPDAGFRRYRSFFTSAAFSVIDCPSMTRMGKNSADIYMVMDILDMLNHKTHFDEFIIFSGDSDFMPVLLRLRAHDRRTTTLAIDFMPPAFRAACDMVIAEEEFIEDALGITGEANCDGSSAGRGRVAMPLLREMAARVYSSACDGGEVAGADLPDILKDFREFRDSSNWLGFGTSQRLAEALACCEPHLQVVRLNPMMYKLVVKQLAQTLTPTAEPTQPAPVLQLPGLAGKKPAAHAERENRTGERSGGEKSARGDLARLRAQVIELVREIVAESAAPVLLARASQFVVSKLGPQVLESQWAGTGSFKRLLQNAGDLGLEITTQPEPGYIFDPSRHPHPAQRRQPGAQAEEASLPQPPTPAERELQPLDAPEPGVYLPPHFEEDTEEEEQYEESLPVLEEFVRRVTQVTGAPHLTPQQNAIVFHGIVNELQSIAEGSKSYNTYQSSKSVSDWCAGQGLTVPRSDIVLIFKGIIFQDGVRFGKRPGSYTVRELALIVRNNIEALCRRSRMELSEYEEHLLDEWLLGELEEEEEQEYTELSGSVEPKGEENQLSLQM